MADKDPKKMTDEELAAAITEDPEVVPEEPTEPAKVESPETPEPPVEEETPEEEPEPVEEPEAEEPEEKPVSRREQLRVQELLSKMKQNQEAAKPVAPTASDALDYDKALDADPELIKKLQEDRDRSNQAMYERGVAQANSIRFHTRLEIDAPRIEQKYPQLDKTSDKFHPALANAINTMFLSAAGYDQTTDTAQNADLRYGDYVESIFELASEIAGEEVQASTTNIAKQAANTAIRPGGGSGKRLNLNQTPQQMSDEELEAKIKSDFQALGLG